MATFPAVLDTCTLYGAYLCNSLLRLAKAGASPGGPPPSMDELERALVVRGLEKKAVTHRIGESWIDLIDDLIEVDEKTSVVDRDGPAIFTNLTLKIRSCECP